MLIDGRGRILIGRRLDTPGEAWQMPQGGIDESETPEQAAWREMREEVGTDKAELLGTTREWVRYDLPPDLAGRLWGGAYRGQEQKWFAFRFTGQDSDIDIARYEPEFAEWRWIDPAELLRIIVPFKRELYARVIEELSPFIALCRDGRAKASARPEAPTGDRRSGAGRA
ncbi:MAG: RNA pyrophosphohydrolase [Rhodospirillaceae bacterium]|nr:RNA pyrophosphohydrolase [Rhodospirillaceae bacterium]